MSSLAHPRGPEPERTYWIRRAIAVVALVVALVVLVGVVRTLFGSSQSSAGPLNSPNPSQLALNVPSSSPSDTASSTATATVSTSPSSAASTASATPSSADPNQPCSSSGVSVTLSAAAQVRSGGTDPLQVRLTNAGQNPCRIDFSRTPLTIRVYSGADRIWATDHCANWAPSGITDALATGKNFTFTVPWPTRRSAAQCTLLPTKLSPGTYVARAFLGSNGQPGQQTIQLSA